MAAIEIVPYKEQWPHEFAQIGSDIRSVLGDTALAIHHIGSTSVPGLCAKDVIDIQITVAELTANLEEKMVSAGYPLARFRTDHCPAGQTLPPTELAKRLFNGPGRRANIHVRMHGKFNQAYPLLCRDYLRAHPAAANAYGDIKLQLARYFPDDVDAYYDIKDPVFDVIMAGAKEWDDKIGWVQPPPDA